VRRFLLIFTLSAFMIALFATPGWTAEGDKVLGTRYARHLVLPILGYQTMDGEQKDFYYQIDLRVDIRSAGILLDTSLVSDSTIIRERSISAPMFGLIYRFRPSHQLNCDLTLAVIHDGYSEKYRLSAEVLEGYTEFYELSVSHGNTTWGNIDIGYNVPIPIKWLGLAVNGGGGYAWRRIMVRNDFEDFSSQVGWLKISTYPKKKEDMFMAAARGGIDMTIWKQDMMIIMGSIFYTQFFPADTDIDPFGGFGWRMAFFPMWSGH